MKVQDSMVLNSNTRNWQAYKQSSQLYWSVKSFIWSRQSHILWSEYVTIKLSPTFCSHWHRGPWPPAGCGLASNHSESESSSGHISTRKRGILPEILCWCKCVFYQSNILCVPLLHMWQSYHSLELRTYFYYEAKRMNIKVKMLIIVKAYQCVWKEPFASSHAGGPGSGWYLAERKAGESSLIHIHFFLLWSCSVMGSWKQVSWTPLSSHLWTPQMWWSSDFHRATPEKQKSVYYTRDEKYCKKMS